MPIYARHLTQESGDLLRSSSIRRDEADIVTNVLHTPDRTNGHEKSGELSRSPRITMRTVVAGNEGAAPTEQDGYLAEIELNSAPNSLAYVAQVDAAISTSIHSPASELEDVDLDSG